MWNVGIVPINFVNNFTLTEGFRKFCYLKNIYFSSANLFLIHPVFAKILYLKRAQHIAGNDNFTYIHTDIHNILCRQLKIKRSGAFSIYEPPKHKWSYKKLRPKSPFWFNLRVSQLLIYRETAEDLNSPNHIVQLISGLIPRNQSCRFVLGTTEMRRRYMALCQYE
jgi:hypothetical protein